MKENTNATKNTEFPPRELDTITVLTSYAKTYDVISVVFFVIWAVALILKLVIGSVSPPGSPVHEIWVWPPLAISIITGYGADRIRKLTKEGAEEYAEWHRHNTQTNTNTQCK